MGPFEQMAAGLIGRPAWPTVKPVKPVKKADRRTSKTERMRAYLREQGEACAAVLAEEGDVETTGLVWALLKSDLASGRVFLRNGKYRWNPQFDEQLHKDLMAAKALLRRHGFEVVQVALPRP